MPQARRPFSPLNYVFLNKWLKTFNIFRCVVRKFCLTCTMTVKRFQEFTGGSWPAWFTSNNYSSHTFKSMSYFSCSFESSKSLAIFFTTVCVILHDSYRFNSCRFKVTFIQCFRLYSKKILLEEFRF